MGMVVREAAKADAAECGRICYDAFAAIAGTHGFAPDFPNAAFAAELLGAITGQPRVYAVVAEDGDRIVGSNFLHERDAIAAVGPITVDPGSQNHGVGALLMRAVMQHAEERKFAGLRLVQAGYHCRSLSLYSRLGFDVREHLSCFQGAPIHKRIEGCTVRVAAAADIEACNTLCRHIHGAARGGELSQAVEQGTARIVERAGRIRGYATAIAFFGHAVAETTDDLKALIAAADAFHGPGFLVPSRNGELMRWCLANGLRVTQPLTLMTIGLYNDPAGAWLPSILY